MSSDGRTIWKDSMPASLAFAPRRDAKLPPPSDSDVFMSLTDLHSSMYLGLVKAFCDKAAKVLLQKGHRDFGQIKVYENSGERRNPPRMLLTFPTIAAARAFYYTYFDYVWTSPDGSQKSIVKLENPIFHKELQDRTKRIVTIGGISRMLAANPDLADRAPMILDHTSSTSSSSAAVQQGPTLPRVPPTVSRKGAGGKGD